MLYFELIYLWISRPNISMDGDEKDIFSKAPDWKIFLLLKIKIKQNPWALIPDVRKDLLTPMIGKRFLHIGKNPSKARCRRTIPVCPKYNWRSVGNATPGKACNIYSHLILQKVFPGLKLTQNCYINIHTFFYKNWQFNHKLDPLSLLQTYRAWKTMLTIWHNTNSRRLQTSQFYSSLVNWVKFGSTT